MSGSMRALVHGLRERAVRIAVDDKVSATWLHKAADALEPRMAQGRPRQRNREDGRLIDSLRADRTHLSESLQKHRMDAASYHAELARCTRRLQATGKCPPAVLEDLQALLEDMSPTTYNQPRKVR